MLLTISGAEDPYSSVSKMTVVVATSCGVLESAAKVALSGPIRSRYAVSPAHSSAFFPNDDARSISDMGHSLLVLALTFQNDGRGTLGTRGHIS